MAEADDVEHVESSVNQVRHGGRREGAGRRKRKSSSSKSRKSEVSKEARAEPSESPARQGVAQAPRKGKGQYFTFTYNLGKDAAVADGRVQEFFANLRGMLSRQEVSFVSVGHEVAPQTGEHHLQGYLETPKGIKWTFARFQELTRIASMEDTAWVVASRGSATENVNYTGKAVAEGRPYMTEGEFRNYGQGRSADMVLVQKKLDAGVPIPTIYKDHFETSAKHSRFFKEYSLVQAKPRAWAMEVVYIYGPSGTGKSRYAQENWPESDSSYWLPKQKSGGNVWWDGYVGQETVVIDEWFPGYFGPGHVNFMLTLNDRYPLRVPVHGGLVMFSSRRIVYTSNYPPSQIDSVKFSGYEWNESNPLYNRVYLRERPWIFLQFGRYARADPRSDEDVPSQVVVRDGVLVGSSSINLIQ